MDMTITDQQLEEFAHRLRTEEKSAATVAKYVRAARRFAAELGSRPLTQEAAVAYKAALTRRYAPAGVNAMLAGLNRFLRHIGREDCRVRRLRVQYQTYCPEEKELTYAEYVLLVRTAQQTGQARTALLLQTLCATGIRISELSAITVEAARRGVAQVRNKGKSRCVLLPLQLQERLLRYAADRRIAAGTIFVTASGAALDRSNIWREMKRLCRAAGVPEEKVFPHNLRYLFARSFYALDADLGKLADLLGHSSIETTRLYIRSTGAEHRSCLDRMQLVL